MKTNTIEKLEPATENPQPHAQSGSRQLDALVRCFCVAAEPSSINRGGDQMGYAVDEDGHTLASHYSSWGWSQHDMGYTSTWKHEAYALRYPEGFRVEWLDAPPADWDRLKAEAPNEKLNDR